MRTSVPASLTKTLPRAPRCPPLPHYQQTESAPQAPVSSETECARYVPATAPELGMKLCVVSTSPTRRRRAMKAQVEELILQSIEHELVAEGLHDRC
jgi:hypothetical protein